MAQKLQLGQPEGGRRPADSKRQLAQDSLRRPVSPAVAVIAAVLVLLALGAGGYYVVNGGWETQAHKEYRLKHEIGPILNAKRGMPEALQRENADRAAHGEPLLQMPKERHQSMEDQKAKLAQMRSLYNGGAR